MPENYIIRTAASKDTGAIARLMVAHALYEKSLIREEGLAARFERQLSKPENELNCLVVEEQGRLIGYTTFIRQFSTWDADFYIYLDCLYLSEEARGRGIGGELMDHIRDYAKAAGCKEIQWQTPDFNTGAIRFYKRLGAESDAKERFFWKV
jgi:GNAT superfamily N-acetyltransferase